MSIVKLYRCRWAAYRQHAYTCTQTYNSHGGLDKLEVVADGIERIPKAVVLQVLESDDTKEGKNDDVGHKQERHNHHKP
jgi:hypothetical protein